MSYFPVSTCSMFFSVWSLYKMKKAHPSWQEHGSGLPHQHVPTEPQLSHHIHTHTHTDRSTQLKGLPQKPGVWAQRRPSLRTLPQELRPGIPPSAELRHDAGWRHPRPATDGVWWKGSAEVSASPRWRALPVRTAGHVNVAADQALPVR